MNYWYLVLFIVISGIIQGLGFSEGEAILIIVGCFTIYKLGFGENKSDKQDENLY